MDTKEKPYSCWCKTTFTRQDLLERHTQIARHGEFGETIATRPTADDGLA
jgi:hypothetical protein